MEISKIVENLNLCNCMFIDDKTKHVVNSDQSKTNENYIIQKFFALEISDCDDNKFVSLCFVFVNDNIIIYSHLKRIVAILGDMGRIDSTQYKI